MVETTKKAQCMHVHAQSLSRVRLLATLWPVACQAPLSMGFSRQAYWSGEPFPSPRDLPNPGIKPGSHALQADSSPSEPPRKPCLLLIHTICFISFYGRYHKQSEWSSRTKLYYMCNLSSLCMFTQPLYVRNKLSFG